MRMREGLTDDSKRVQQNKLIPAERRARGKNKIRLWDSEYFVSDGRQELCGKWRRRERDKIRGLQPDRSPLHHAPSSIKRPFLPLCSTVAQETSH